MHNKTLYPTYAQGYWYVYYHCCHLLNDRGWYLHAIEAVVQLVSRASRSTSGWRARL